ncbi:MAG: stage V sporulation protein AB [Eubacteriales bacterium]
MFLREFLLGICGLSLGFAVSGGVFTVLVAVGLVTRFVGKTGTASNVLLYETMISLGTIVGGIATVYPTIARELFRHVHGEVTQVALVIFGLFGGIFLGCLAIAIAEMLNGIPIMARRFRYLEGLGCAVLAIALGKMAGSILYFLYGFYE